ncbi:MAG TPA: hypothetical protein HPP77_01425 [Candidatus Hydrogenedentes bacterium]|nr:hypothetical protein [Candidatus Hydrogenedentota bacterium]HIJ73039.1 hypothetical protein [Candidatus Hydrogenedentota bacterium]
MSERALDEICSKLRARLGEWETQGAAAREGLANHIAGIQDLLRTLANDIGSQEEACVAFAKSIGTHTDALEQALAERDGSAQEEKQRTTQLEAGLAQQVDATQAAKQRIEQLEKSLDKRTKEAEAAAQRIAQFETMHADQSNAAQAAKGRIAELEKELEKRQQVETAATDRLAELTTSEATLRDELEALRAKTQKATAAAAELATAQGELAKARDQIDALRAAADKADDVAKLLEAERARSAAFEQRLKKAETDAAKDTDAAQLAEALRDLEAARAETAALRDEAKALRQSAAPPASLDDSKIRKRRSPKDIRRQMGEVLLNVGVITQEQFDAACEQQGRAPERTLGEILVDQGYASEEIVAQALACQHGSLFVRLGERKIDPSAAALVSSELARNHSCIPINAAEDMLVVAMANPLDVIAIEDIERETELTVRPVVATRSEIAAALRRTYKDAPKQERKQTEAAPSQDTTAP